MTDFTNEESLDPQNFNDKIWGSKQLRRITLFEYLSDSELEDLYEIGEVKLFKPKCNVIIEAESSRGLYVLLRGAVSVFKLDKSSDQLIRLTMLEEGAIFGELSLFDDAPRSATVIAENTCSLFYLDAEGFNEHLDQLGNDLKTRFYKKCAEEMAERFRVQNADYIASQHLLWQHALRTNPERQPR